ncbi:YceI-like domain-containing protein [Variovorax paradoxus B4]|uniref:YceI-like domain-containing protein n=1 Tax=Variovorax paradoxus B4 TaxID=1246301 RepID=T1XKP8_VARPD|nr:YceI family protein [Variovorax paradoxus]AGU53467.1 YceI-like domain-containing protein [Variovorax paradoxus B4]
MPDTSELSTLASSNLADVSRGRYVIDPVHSHVLFSVSHFGISTYHGEFAMPGGTLDVPLSAGESHTRLAVSVPVANVKTTSPILDDELRSRDWLDGERFPLITFDFAAPLSLAANSFQVTGALALHGVTRNVTFDVSFVGAGMNPAKQVYTIGFDIRGRIRRSDYGVTAALPMIGDELSLIISAAFELEASAA